MARKQPAVRRFDVFLVALDPTRGSEIRKTRPCIVISPDEMNRPLSTAIVAPMTSGQQAYPSRVQVTFKGKGGHVALDQIRTVDKVRLVKRLGRLEQDVSAQILSTLQNMFAP